MVVAVRLDWANGRYRRISLKKSRSRDWVSGRRADAGRLQLVRDGRVDLVAAKVLCRYRHLGRWSSSQLGELMQVLCDRSDEELIPGAGGATQLIRPLSSRATTFLLRPMWRGRTKPDAQSSIRSNAGPRLSVALP